MNPCEYKQTIRGDAADRIRRKYKRLTGKDSPPVDTIKFTRDKIVKRTNFVYNNKTVRVEHGLDVSKTYHFADDPVGILISVGNYVEDGGHAISAVKYGGTLYAFNAWGKKRKAMDTRIFGKIMRLYACKSAIVYNGPSLQEKNNDGVCVAFASNYITEMFLKIASGRFPRKSQFHRFVHTAMTERGICFGTRCEDNIKLGSVQKMKKMHKNLMRPVITPTNLSKMKVANLRRIANSFDINHRGIVKRVLRTKLEEHFAQPPVQFRSISVSKKKKKQPVVSAAPLVNEKFRTLADVQAYARARCIKGRSLHRRKSDLIAHVRAHNRTPPKPMSNSNIAGLRAQNLRDYARDRCIPGYSKYTKKADLKKYLIAKKYVRK